jgi:hypothetical protein
MVLLVAATCLAAGTAAWAGSKSQSVKVTLDTPTVVSGKTLPPGDYRLSWVGDTSKVDVTFERDSRVVAQANATLENLPERSPEQELISRKLKDGERALEEVRPRHQSTALVFPVS